jgi:protein-disulfide isomerase
MSSNDRPRPNAAVGRRARRERIRADRAAAQPGRPRRSGERPTTRQNGGPSLAVLATIAALVGGVILIAAVVLLQGPPAESPAGGTAAGPTANLVAPSSVVPADLGDTPNTLGSATAPLKMEITEDFQCPICGQFSRDDLPRLIADFVRPGLVRIVTHDVEFLDRGDSRESLDAATAAACAGEQGRYWEYHDWLYGNQRGENQGAFSRDRLTAIATQVELDQAAFGACLSGPTEQAKVTAATDAAVGAGITGTPTFVVNGGHPIKGLPTYDALASYLRSLLPSASASASPSPS